MTLNKQALREAAKDNVKYAQMFINPRDMLALLDENARLTDERNALRETMGGDNTRAAADIYFQLVEECEIPPGGSLVGHVDCMRDDLASAERRIAELEASTITVTLPMPYDINVAGERIDWDKGDHFDHDEVIEALRAAGIKIKGE